MSIDRLVLCTCGHSVNVHDVSGCNTLLRNGPDFEVCSCPLTRGNALDRLIDAQVVPPEESWLALRRRSKAPDAARNDASA